MHSGTACSISTIVYGGESLNACWLAIFGRAGIVIAIAAAALGQEPSSQGNLPDAPSSGQPQANSSAQNPVALFIMLDRRSIAFPDIATKPGPLSTRGKFQLFVNNSASLHVLFGAALGAGYAQAIDSPEGYGQGGEGYAKRFGSLMARGASNEFFSTFLLASALHQDPRFFPEKNPTFASSLKYSMTRVFVTRNDSGTKAANWSGLLGPLLGESLANAYWPERDRSAGQTFTRWGTDLAVRAGGNMLRNYWPVLFKSLHKSAPAPATKPDGSESQAPKPSAENARP